MPLRSACALVVAVASCALLAPAAASAQTTPSIGLERSSSDPLEVPRWDHPDVQRLKFSYGPVKIWPGQNDIRLNPLAVGTQRPREDGFIVRFKPDLRRMDGTVPPVDVIHLHHGVWVVNGQPVYAAGEEKTIFQAPRGFGERYRTSDSWFLNDMIHNLLPDEERIRITYDIDFVPLNSGLGQQLREMKTKWMDVAGISAYPVFDLKQGQGRNGKAWFPQDADAENRRKVGSAIRWRVDRPITLLATAGHLHPGGLQNRLKVTRDGRTVTLFNSRAKYFEEGGRPVSWDLAMTASPENWRVNLRPGDVLSTDVQYETKLGSWYESMGIMVHNYMEGHSAAGKDPFVEKVQTEGKITHGPLAENDNKGGRPSGLPDPRRMLSGRSQASGVVNIKDFIYARGDLGAAGLAQRPPTIKAGQSITFKNREGGKPADARLGRLNNCDGANVRCRQTPPIYHTITSCKAPCNGTTGVDYPLAGGRGNFDSGELGYGPRFFSAAAQRDTWKTPKDLGPGTYTYFCRIHPFMRGSFRVTS